MIVCSGCGQWVRPEIDQSRQTVTCPECGHAAPRRFLPLFIVTGASGTGKTAVVAELQRLMPLWDVFETDILWDSGGSWETVKCNWLRIAHSIAQSGRPTILCGTIFPDDLNSCEALPFFTRIHWLALHCDDGERAKRLRARPAFRETTDEFIARQAEAARWLIEHAEKGFDPPLVILDTTDSPVGDTARQVRGWALDRWRDEVGQEHTERSARKTVSSGSPYEPIIGISRAVRVGSVITVSGTAPLGPDRRTVGLGNAAAQARRCFEIVEQALRDLGAGLSDVVRTRTLLANIADWEAVGRVHGEIFREVRPANTVMQVVRFIDPDWLVEIEADAIVE